MVTLGATKGLDGIRGSLFIEFLQFSMILNGARAKELSSQQMSCLVACVNRIVYDQISFALTLLCPVKWI